MPRRVVITGLGAVTPFGVGVAPLWQGLCAGESRLAPIRSFDASGFRSHLAAELDGFSAREYVPKHYRKAVKVMARDIELAVAAAADAVRSTGIATRCTLEETPGAATTHPANRMGCNIGAGLIAAETEEISRAFVTSRDAEGAFSIARWGETGMDALTPLWLLKYLPNMLACHVTILHGLTGPSNTITACESSGLLSIGESVRVIERGAADLAFSGGAESKVNPMGLMRMDLCNRLAHTGGSDDGPAFVLPYDSRASGTLLGEGGAILILENAESARSRSAAVLAEIVGFGAAQSSPFYEEREKDEGCELAIRAALEDAGLAAGDLDAVFPLGAGIPSMDAAEGGALKRVLGPRAAEIPICPITPTIGDTMAGAGAIQAAVAVTALVEQRLPARLHKGRPDPGLAAAGAPSTAAQLANVLVCTPALGGQNAALVIRTPSAGRAA